MPHRPVEPNPDEARAWLEGRYSLVELFPLDDAAKALDVHKSTPVRWAFDGCAGQTLRTLMRGGRRCTTRRWLEEFFEAVTRARRSAWDRQTTGTGPAPAGPVRSPERRREDAARAA